MPHTVHEIKAIMSTMVRGDEYAKVSRIFLESINGCRIFWRYWTAWLGKKGWCLETPSAWQGSLHWLLLNCYIIKLDFRFS